MLIVQNKGFHYDIFMYITYFDYIHHFPFPSIPLFPSFFPNIPPSTLMSKKKKSQFHV
jgi:hypothetical protein